MTVQEKKKQPKKSSAFGGRLLELFWGLKYNHFLEFQNIIYTYWVHLMEHIYFKAQLCIDISKFTIILNIGILNHVYFIPVHLLVRKLKKSELVIVRNSISILVTVSELVWNYTVLGLSCQHSQFQSQLKSFRIGFELALVWKSVSKLVGNCRLLAETYDVWFEFRTGGFSVSNYW